jgi:hypothetical protein
MSSWYVFAALGLYPVCPCRPDYVLGVPLFDRAEVRFEDGSSFTVKKSGAGRYVKAATWNGESLGRSFLTHGEIAGGGQLVLVLGEEPGGEWGKAMLDRPLSTLPLGERRVLAAPRAKAESDVFRGSLTVALESSEPGAKVFYRLSKDGDFSVYEAPLDLTETTAVRFFAQRGDLRSPVVEASFHQIPSDWTVTLARPPSPMYDPGATALIDGIRASSSWRVGGWHGFREGDFEVTVDLGTRRAVHRAGAGFLQDTGSWIWLPRGVSVSVSDDGESFREVARISHDVPEDSPDVELHNLTAELEDVAARFVRVRAQRFGTIPDWHPGRGEEGWTFVDEVVVE